MKIVTTITYKHLSDFSGVGKLCLMAVFYAEVVFKVDLREKEIVGGEGQQYRQNRKKIHGNIFIVNQFIL